MIWQPDGLPDDILILKFCIDITACRILGAILTVIDVIIL